MLKRISLSIAFLLAPIANEAVANSLDTISKNESKIKIDCHGPDGKPSWANSESRFTLTFYGAEEASSVLYGIPFSRACNKEYSIIIGFNSLEVEQVKVQAHGGDAAWIDSIEIDNVKSGRNNSKGWIMSTQSSDSNYNYSNVSAHDCRIFTKGSDTAPTC